MRLASQAFLILRREEVKWTVQIRKLILKVSDLPLRLLRPYSANPIHNGGNQTSAQETEYVLYQCHRLHRF